MHRGAPCAPPSISAEGTPLSWGQSSPAATAARLRTRTSPLTRLPPVHFAGRAGTPRLWRPERVPRMWQSHTRHTLGGVVHSHVAHSGLMDVHHGALLKVQLPLQPEAHVKTYNSCRWHTGSQPVARTGLSNSSQHDHATGMSQRATDMHPCQSLVHDADADVVC